MNPSKTIVEEMFEKDAFSKWLGIELLEINEGSCSIRMKVRSEMLNGHGTMHGGISFSLADSALAFASNSRGKKAVSIETSIAHIAPVFENDILIAHCEEINCGKTIARYQTKIYLEESNLLVGNFLGTVVRLEK